MQCVGIGLCGNRAVCGNRTVWQCVGIGQTIYYVGIGQCVGTGQLAVCGAPPVLGLFGKPHTRGSGPLLWSRATGAKPTKVCADSPHVVGFISIHLSTFPSNFAVHTHN